MIDLSYSKNSFLRSSFSVHSISAFPIAVLQAYACPFFPPPFTVMLMSKLSKNLFPRMFSANIIGSSIALFEAVSGSALIWFPFIFKIPLPALILSLAIAVFF